MPKERKIKLPGFKGKDFKSRLSHAPANVKIQQPDGVGFPGILFFTIGRTGVLSQHFGDKVTKAGIACFQLLKLRGYLGLPLFGQTQTWTRYTGPGMGPMCKMP